MSKSVARDIKGEDLVRWSECVLTFVKELDPQNPVWDRVREVLARTAQAGNIKALRSIARDLSEMASGLSETEMAALEQHLERALGPDAAVMRVRRGK